MWIGSRERGTGEHRTSRASSVSTYGHANCEEEKDSEIARKNDEVKHSEQRKRVTSVFRGIRRGKRHKEDHIIENRGQK